MFENDEKNITRRTVFSSYPQQYLLFLYNNKPEEMKKLRKEREFYQKSIF